MSKKNKDNGGFGILVKILIGIVVAIGLFYLFLLFTRWIDDINLFIRSSK